VTIRAALLCAAVAIAGCTNATQQTSASAQPETAETASPVAIASESPASSAPPVTAQASLQPSPSATAASTLNPNLLSFSYGTFVRHWTPGASADGANQLPAGGGWNVKSGMTQPVALVFELPAPAHLTAISMRTYPPSNATFAISDDDRTYRDFGHVTTADSSSAASVATDANGRYVRVTFTPPVAQGFSVASVTAGGTMDSPAPASLDGRWIAADDEEVHDTAIKGITSSIPAMWGASKGRGQYATFVHDGTLTAFSCTSDLNTAVWRGAIAGNGASNKDDTLHVVAGGTLLVGHENLHSVLAHRVADASACSMSAAGSGPEVAVFTRLAGTALQAGDPKLVPGHRYVRTPLPLLDRHAIGDARAVLIDDSCSAGKDLADWQVGELLQWVNEGHALVLRDADKCPAVDYGFLPYSFTTSAGGAAASSGKNLEVVASSTLGSSNRSDRAHYIDVPAYLHAELQQLGDTEIMTTHDPHWCGLMYAVNRYGAGGWVHAYARYGKGLIVYNGFDEDDLYTRIEPARRISQLEYAQSPAGALPCAVHVADGPPQPAAAAAVRAPATKTAIAKALLQSKRARIYGIHFDVASARIQPQSERVIGEIAQVLREYPSWRMLVEGHTDSDGGAQYNLALSLRRAESVVTDLDHRYHVSPARLRAAGYGQTRPVASNSTSTGKALNRRVELVRY
jgi:outer membrane protein OmpA-like peptidoglycan-associated protein